MKFDHQIFEIKNFVSITEQNCVIFIEKRYFANPPFLLAEIEGSTRLIRKQMTECKYF